MQRPKATAYPVFRDSSSCMPLDKALKLGMNLFIKSALTGVKIVAIVASLGVIYGFAADRALVYTYAVNSNLVVCVIILISGLIKFMTPTSLLIKKGRLVDHTTYSEKFKEIGECKNRTAYELIYIGIVGIALTAAIQFLLYVVF